MTSYEIREKFLQFFKEKGHAIIPSASLIPENDPSVLFTTAGMHPLVPYLKGEKHPLGKRLTDVQKCLRTGDIDEVGDSSHLTFFEMLGYWSLGDYFKKESIHYTFDFYTEVLGFDEEKISVTVFEGDTVAPFDQESYDTWKDEIGIPAERIYKYGVKENWWGLASGIGPCGPCTEMFVDTGKNSCGENCGPSCDCGKFVEIGNNVFIEFLKKEDGSIEKLGQRNVDVGLGLERLTMFNQGKESVFETDLFEPIMAKIRELSTKEDIHAERIIADHIRAATFVLGDERVIEPSNVGAGYVLRRLIRRAIRYGRQLGIEGSFTSKIAEVVVEKMKAAYPELEKNKSRILDELNKEEERFAKTLENGLKEFDRIVGAFHETPDKRAQNFAPLQGQDAFLLFQSYGFPIEMTVELASEKGLKVDLEGFEKEFKKHQDLSRTASTGMFKGGLADNSEITVKYHTTTHLLLAALRQVLGGEIYQKGSNITAERMRFDFNYPEKLTEEQIKTVEDIVNEKISAAIPVEMVEMPKEEALKISKVSFDPSKYPDIVKVYKIGDPALGPGQAFSIEVCGGPHVANTSDLGHFRIIKEESSSSGVRRIKAILENKNK
ncbi:MAG: alanine--tRNA ligase [Patescibacteria group bacterium]|nr:alanine--tRNA ligase [Patescibacteria group bacterium]